MAQTLKDTRRLKGLQSQVTAAQHEADMLKLEIANKQREHQFKINQIREIQNHIKKLEGNKKIKVTEHAIVRYLERVKGVDVSQIEKEIVTEQLQDLVETLGGDGGYPVRDFKVLMKNFNVTTILK